MLNLSASRNDYRLPQRLDHARRQVLCDAATRHEPWPTARKVEYDIAQCENRCQGVPQAMVGAGSVDGKATHHSRVGGVRREVEFAGVYIVVPKLPEVRLGVGNVCAESVADALSRNARELPVLEALHINVEAHGVVERPKPNRSR